MGLDEGHPGQRPAAVPPPSSKGLKVSSLSPDTTQPSDADLLSRLAAGDQQAFAVIYDRYRQEMLNCVRQQNRSLDEHAARDLVSEVFRSILQDRHRLRFVRNLRVYLLAIAGNLSARSRRNPTTLPLPVGIISPDLPPDAAMEQDEQSYTIKRAMASLPDSHRKVLELVRDGHSVKDIASATNCTPKAVRRRMEKALAQVRTTLSPCCSPCALEQQHPEKCPARKENIFCDKLRQWIKLHYRR